MFCVELNRFREHKFKYNVLDNLNRICPCGSDKETLSHFFLHCPPISKRQILPRRKKKSQDSFKQNDCIILVLLYGGVSFPFTENTSLLNTSVEYMTTKRFDTLLMIDT